MTPGLGPIKKKAGVGKCEKQEVGKVETRPTQESFEAT